MKEGDDIPGGLPRTDSATGGDPESPLEQAPEINERLLAAISTPPSERLVFETIADLRKALGM
jgi:hypothetical protein